MKKFIEWFKSQTTQAKVMMIFIVILVVFIMTRWAWVGSEISRSFIDRFSPQPVETPVDRTSSQPADTTGSHSYSADSL